MPLDLAALVGPDPRWHRLTDATNHVARVTGPRGSLILKKFTSDRPYRQELHAYTEWCPHLSPRTPTLLAADAAARTLLLTAAAGRPALDLDLASERAAHWHAGRFLRDLHALPVTQDDPLPLSAAISRRHAAWLRRAAPHLTAAQRARLTALGERIPALFAAAARVPTHRDFTPRNWLMPDPTALTILDFEHARPDTLLIDLVKLAAETWPARPDLESALLGGYGRDLTPDERAQLQLLVAQHAMATLAWAHDHADPTFLAAGHTALTTALA